MDKFILLLNVDNKCHTDSTQWIQTYAAQFFWIIQSF